MLSWLAHVELLGGEGRGQPNMVKFNQDHFKAISSTFHFLAMLSYPYPPPLATQHAWAGLLNMESFLKWPKNLSGDYFLWADFPKNRTVLFSFFLSFFDLV